MVEVDENLNERVSYTLSKAGVFITAALLDVNEREEVRRKIREIENVL